LARNRLDETRTARFQYRYTDFSYNAANQLTAVNGSAVTSDANGSVTGYGNDSYSWDTRNRLVGITRTGGNPLAAAFVYDWQGKRASHTIIGTTITMLNDGPDCVAETSGGVTMPCLHGPGIDEPLIRGAEYYQQDGLGSVTNLSDCAGNTIGGYHYEPFGEVATGPAGNPYQFTGRENDGTGLYYYRARYYAPEWGRFLSADPAGFDAGHNRFAQARPVQSRRSPGCPRPTPPARPQDSGTRCPDSLAGLSR